MTDAKPYPKASQLARGERRYRRKVASPEQWQAIIAAKTAPCRVCGEYHWPSNPLQFHHLIPRSIGGDDVADNLVPLCAACHADVTNGRERERRLLAESLADAEYAYVIGKLGESGMERLFGVSAR